MVQTTVNIKGKNKSVITIKKLFYLQDFNVDAHKSKFATFGTMH